MSNWYYFNENNEKVGPVSSTVLKELARQGLITKETKIVNSNGRSAVAGQVNGLVFSETRETEPPPFESAGLDFPALVSEGQTPDDFDPFAQAATFPASPSTASRTFRKSPRIYQEKPKPGLWDWLLLDFRFRFFVTPTLLKGIWCIWVVVIEFLIVSFIVGIVVMLISSMLPDMSTGKDIEHDWRSDSESGGLMLFLLTRLVPIILIPMIVATFLLCIRIALESVMVAFRISEHLKNIDEKI